jgi:hypothetical protein
MIGEGEEEIQLWTCEEKVLYNIKQMATMGRGVVGSLRRPTGWLMLMQILALSMVPTPFLFWHTCNLNMHNSKLK